MYAQKQLFDKKCRRHEILVGPDVNPGEKAFARFGYKIIVSSLSGFRLEKRIDSRHSHAGLQKCQPYRVLETNKRLHI